MEKCATVPSGTGCPLWSLITPVRMAIVSPILKSGTGVATGVGTFVEMGAAAMSKINGMIWFGSGAVILIRSYPSPGMETGDAPEGVNS